MIRKLNKITKITEYSKKKLRKFIIDKFNLQKNIKTATLVKKTNVKNENELFKKLIKKYNKMVDEKNAILLQEQKAKRALNAYKTRIRKIIPTLENRTFTGLNTDKFKIIIELLRNTNNKYLIQVGNKVYTLTDTFIEHILDPEYVNIGFGSDAEIIEIMNDIDTIRIEKIVKKEKFKKGKFFKYNHLLKGLDLTELQIYEDFKPEYYTENCFIKSLIGQVDESIINDCKMIIWGKDTSLKSIQEIADKHDLTIEVKVDDKHTRHYGNGKTKVNICLLDDHYFKLIQIPITSFAIKNYFDICEKEDWNKIYTCENGKYKRKNRFIDSYHVVKLLLENKDTLLTEITKSDDLYNTCYFDDIKKIGSLEYNDSNVELNEYKPRDDKNITNIFFDFEASTNGDKHKPYLCCIKSDKIKSTFYGEDCGLQMLRYLHKLFKNKEIKLIAHNITYDLKFIFDHLNRANFIQRGNQIMSGSGYFWNFGTKLKILFQDSYTLITDKLSNFGKMFGLQQEKEFIPYDLYNHGYDRFVLHDIIRKHTDYQVKCNNIGLTISDEEYETYYNKFMENAKKWNCINGDKIDIIKYSDIYCQMDCEILELGYNTFKNMIQTVCDLNIDNYISIASVADTYMLKQGVYDDVYKLSGVVREFIQLCVVGGRTMVSKNKKKKVIGKKLDDFDAVSLYPSAMSRLCGYLQGKPKILQTTDYNIIKNYDGFFVECKVKSIGKKRNFPLLSYIDEEGVRIFSNDMINKTVYLDKISFEDAITFQDIEFEIIRGYYYDKGRNLKLKETIDYMFNERLRLKSEGNPLQNVFKLLMNSSYGKTILKPIDTDIKYYDKEEDYNAALIANYSFVKEAFEIGKKYCIKFIKPIVSHFNNASCGVEVLSMSKRIMNEVICLAEDNKKSIYYQDTDSMHIQSKSVNKLAKLYYEKYNRQLIGKNMGQFHTDFDSKILTGNIYAKESIFLGKKCYLDVLTDESGKIDYHIRMKGISGVSVMHHADKDFNGDISKLYDHLYNGNAYNFDLTCNKYKSCFEMVDMNTIKTKDCFMREVKFL